MLLPFVIFVAVGLPQVEPSRWLAGIDSVAAAANASSIRGSDGVDSSASSYRFTWSDYCTFISVLYWNFSGGDQLATFAGEVKQPHKTYPRAALWGVGIVSLNYLLPLLVVSGVLESGPQLSNFTVGGFPEVAELVGGAWLKWMVLCSSWLGCCALFFAEICEDAYLLMGMSEMGLAPKMCQSRHTSSKTPTRALVVGALLVTILSLSGSFVQIVALDNAFNCTSVLLELAAAVWLRFKHPQLIRPFKFPVSDWQLVAVLTVPTLLTVVVGVSSLAADKTGAAALAFFAIALILLVLHEGLLKTQWRPRRNEIPLNMGRGLVDAEAEGSDHVDMNRVVSTEI